MKVKKRNIENIADIFNITASTYDCVGPSVFSYFGNLLVELAGIRKGTRVLDIGAGRGAVVFPAAAKVGIKGYVTGIDIAENMIKETKKQIKQNGLKNVSMTKMDACHLLFENNHFEYVMCGFSIFFFPRPLKVLQEIMRVLKRDGLVGITSRILDEESYWLGKLLDDFGIVEADRDKGNNCNSLTPDLHTSSGIKDALSLSGFTDIKIYHKEVFFIYNNKEQWFEWLWTNGTRRYLEKMSTDQLKKFKVRVFDNLSRYENGGGLRVPFRAIIGLGKKV